MTNRQEKSGMKTLADGATLTYRLFFHEEDGIWKEQLFLANKDETTSQSDTHDLIGDARCALGNIFDSIQVSSDTFASVRSRILDRLNS